MARPAALVDAMAAALVTTLGTIDSTADANKWFTKPLSIVRGARVRLLTIADRPAIAVEIESADLEMRSSSLHGIAARFTIYGIAQDPQNDQQVIVRLASDILEALALDEYLGGLLERALETPSFTIDNDAAGAGLGLCKVSVICRAIYDHSTSAMP